MIGGEIDVLLGIPGIFAAVGLGYVAMVPPAPIYSVLSFIAVLGTVIMFPFFRAAIHAHALRSMDVEAVENAYSALAINGTNVSARMRIARLIFEMGLPGHALKIAEYCLATSPAAFFPEEHKLVHRWRMTRMPANAFDPINCIQCGQPNPPGNLHCPACGSRIILDRIKGRAAPSAMGKKLLAVWITMVALIAGIPLVSQLSRPIALAGVFGLIGLGLAVVIVAFRPGKEAE
jgi:hypothetical protein